MSEKVEKSETEWRDQLSSEQYYVTREKGTEPAFTGVFNDCKTSGTYVCVCCGADLFDSETKFNSGTGWPSFYQALHDEAVAEERDMSFGMARTEVMCACCDAHLGHVFPDGPAPTGLRYCINSLSLGLKERDR